MKSYIYGAGGHAKVVWDAMKKSNLVCEGFIDDRRLGQWIDLPIYTSSFLNDVNADCGVCVFCAKVKFLSAFDPFKSDNLLIKIKGVVLLG